MCNTSYLYGNCNMKKFALAVAIGLCSTFSYSADWTPVFKTWETGAGNNTVLQKIRDYTFTGKSTSFSATLNPKAKQGNYSVIPQPYRADMLPAKIKIIDKRETTFEIVIPLKNATLYGLPISNLTMYSCLECGYAGDYVTFKPMSDAKYRQLKNRHFYQDIKAVEEDETCFNKYQAEVTKSKNGSVILGYDYSC